MSHTTRAKIEIYVDEQSQIAIQSVRDNGVKGVPINIPIGDIFNNPKGSAAKILGESIIQHLKIIQPNRSTDTSQNLSFDNSASIDDYEIVHRLIEISISQRTSLFLSAIESLLLKLEGDLNEANIFLSNSWPTIRERIISFPDTQKIAN